MTKEFIIKSLLPYKQNPDLCGYNGTMCAYLTKDNKKCAVGQYMKEGPWQKSEDSVLGIFQEYPEKDIMTDEWIQEDIPYKVAEAMQGYHDELVSTMFGIKHYVDILEYYTGFNLSILK